MAVEVREQPAAARSTRRALGIVWRLSRADLQHEWILSACLVMAIAAVMSPLLLLFGLKYGTIETLRYRLVQDPRNREVQPLTSRAFSREWFEDVASRPDVDFVVPTTRQISASVTARIKGKEDEAELNIVPTGEGDPLLLENRSVVPGLGECVLSHFAAEALQAQIGDTIEITAKRILGGQYESGTTDMRVVGILTVRASALKSMYVPLDILEAVERFKDGQAVPEFGWSGSTPTAYALYNGLLVFLPKPLAKVQELSLRNNTGFTRIEKLTVADLQAQAQLSLGRDWAVYLLSTAKKPVDEESVNTVRHKLRGQESVLVPWIKPLPAKVLDGAGHEIADVALHALSIAPSQAEQLQLNPVPDWGETGMARQLMLPAGVTIEGTALQLRVAGAKGNLVFPVTPVETRTASAKAVFVPMQLAGVLNLFQSRDVGYEADTDQFVLSRRGYAGFRLYAKTIDAVDGLRQHFDTQSIPVHTEAQRINDVKELDTYLTLIFWFIAAVGIVGGTTALLASLYASVERKKRDLSVLRLIGLSRMSLFRYPIYQGIMISSGGYLVAMAFFITIALAINSWFASHLAPGESFCRLPVFHAVAALCLTLLVAILAASCAAWRVMQIEPAEALRDE